MGTAGGDAFHVNHAALDDAARTLEDGVRKASPFGAVLHILTSCDWGFAAVQNPVVDQFGKKWDDGIKEAVRQADQNAQDLRAAQQTYARADDSATQSLQDVVAEIERGV